MKRVAVLTTNGELKFTDIEKKAELEELRKLVAGNIEMVPYTRDEEETLIVYANEEGEIKDLPGNYVGANVVIRLGFYAGGFCTLYGDLVVCNASGKSLTKKQQDLIQKQYNEAKKEYAEDDE